MPKVALLNINGDAVGEIELSDEIFAVEVNEHVLHQVVKAQLANRRQGTQSALTRSEVSGGGIKPWRQKGSGRARQGSTRSPQWRHGGIVFAPKPRSYRMEVPKKVRRLAMKSALSSKVNDSELVVLDQLNLDAPKTKEMVKVLNNLKAERKVLLVLPEKDEVVERAARNLPNVKMLYVNTLNVYDILNYDKFIATKAAVEKIQEVYA
ncbi:50S ribosomal protein L4 [Gehongia tenuis]|jgi:large subunit ribosomal protein L4|uniref:Large ribosomal subunit protein uL4 n=1 Tax=Gehongia tenuis TaxID=2763655 RepID=A0A926D560_9FIRM|nr:50S ribosomal protein L4 [Gehongia tenuis]MBC8531609.1 50S ribosomal protein L4 [Gehongia tenuis]